MEAGRQEPKPRRPGRALFGQLFHRFLREYRGKRGPRRLTEARKEKKREARRAKRRAERGKAVSNTKDAGDAASHTVASAKETSGVQKGSAVNVEAQEATHAPTQHPKGESFLLISPPLQTPFPVQPLADNTQPESSIPQTLTNCVVRTSTRGREGETELQQDYTGRSANEQYNGKREEGRKHYREGKRHPSIFRKEEVPTLSSSPLSHSKQRKRGDTEGSSGGKGGRSHKPGKSDRVTDK